MCGTETQEAKVDLHVGCVSPNSFVRGFSGGGRKAAQTQTSRLTPYSLSPMLPKPIPPQHWIRNQASNRVTWYLPLQALRHSDYVLRWEIYSIRAFKAVCNGVTVLKLWVCEGWETETHHTGVWHSPTNPSPLLHQAL